MQTSKIVFGASRQGVEQLTTEMGFGFRKGIHEAHEIVAALHERQRPSLQQSLSDKYIAEFLRNQPPRIIRDGPWSKGANFVGKRVVAAQSSDLLDEIDFGGDIIPP